MTAFEKLKQKWDENPMEMIVVSAFAATAAAKLIDAVSSTRSRSAYARQIDRNTRRRK